jgi:hypothetical protein
MVSSVPLRSRHPSPLLRVCLTPVLSAFSVHDFSRRRRENVRDKLRPYGLQKGELLMNECQDLIAFLLHEFSRACFDIEAEQWLSVG